MKIVKRRLIKDLLSAPFIILLLVAFVLWFLTMLAKDYSTILELEVEIESDYDSNLQITDNLVSVNVLASGNGRDLLQYKFGLAEDIVVPLSKLSLSQDSGAEPFFYRIDGKSMEQAIASEQPRFTVQMVVDTIQQVRVSPLITKLLPLYSMIDIECADGYMLEGGVSLSLDSISVKMPEVIEENIKAIYTEPLEFDAVRGHISGIVSIALPLDVVASEDVVRYSADIVGFTEEVYNLKVNMDKRQVAVVSPRYVNVITRVPLNKNSRQRTAAIEAYVDSTVSDLNGIMRRVRLRGVPEDVITYSIEPEYVEVHSIK